MVTANKKMRFRNRQQGLQVIYDEAGTKKELVPGATIFLDPEWAGRFRCLEKVVSEKTGPGKQPKENNKEE